MSSVFQPKSLVLDLEVAPDKSAQFERIFKVGAMRPDLRVELEQDVTKNLAAVLTEVDALAEGARFLLGHNILEHDIPLLKQQAPNLALHALPVIDTLRLSPLAFPQNPYHRLVKDYKLIRDSLNSPLADCRSTLVLFQDQRDALTQLNETNRAELLCYQGLLAPSIKSDLGSFFATLTGQAVVELNEVRQRIPELLAESDTTLERDLKVCRTRLEQLLQQDLFDSALHLPLAYALAWLRVSGGNSVLAPWVRHQFPAVGRLISELRDVPCGQADCQYCNTTHDPRSELKRHFGFEDFRYERPGESLQHDVVLAGMQGQHVLAILATGGGKSLCYQLPALNRYHRNASLTVIISPLQSLMKDQVDGLLARNVQCAATLNGLLTMPERAEVLEKIQMGDVGILLVSPEQFRNKAFRRAIAQRQIGAWIFDEAHCLSKWGNDFRPDYLYASRFIREHTGDQPLAPIGCFTATAKPDVLADIRAHFRDGLGIEFKEFLGTHERSNLSFEVFPCHRGEKWPRTHQLLEDHLGHQDGSAVVFVASRSNAEELAEFLSRQGWACRHFHAGLEPNDKKDIQDDFKAGQLRIIVATNAFGMGVDKADIRLVIHADIPGSLENYLQEAGRAGRDQEAAHCVLLYDEQDIETQFGLCERSKLSLRDIQQILRKLRKEYDRRKGAQLVITAGEILLDDSVETSFDAGGRDSETKVVTAIAWLERGQYLKREENSTQIFPGRLVLSEEDAERQLKNANLPERQYEMFSAILRYLYQADADERVNTDNLMQLTSLPSEEVACILRQLEALGLLVNDTQLTVLLRHGIADASAPRLEKTLALEQALLDLLSELAPDAHDGTWQDLNVAALTSGLKTRMERDDVIPLEVMRLLGSLSKDRENQSQSRNSFELKQINPDYIKLKVRDGHNWAQIRTFGNKRRTVAGQLLKFLLAKLAPTVKGKDLMVESTFGELVGLIETDLELAQTIPMQQRPKAIEHVLLYLHNQQVLTLNHGMTVMRRAMTIEVNTDKKGAYRKEDYQRLDEHYNERRIQVHVMREYAELARSAMASALELVLHYFSDSKESFLQRYFAGREKVLRHATSEESWRSIVEALSGRQKVIVADDDDVNRLVLAGPGSGKTRVIVHRIAYLLRVRRVPASAIVALTFNRHAANEIRQRLLSLVGADAYGVSVMTYHSMAMRLTGTRFERGDSVSEQALSHVMKSAVDLLEGKGTAEGEDDLREQLMRGYRYIMVDEYQDIDALQYRLVSALAGRKSAEDGRLCILAVGDDDQNIYAWRDTNNRYIQQFCTDYTAQTSYLVENYRSSQHIITAANQLIGHNPDRLKAAEPIQINHGRIAEPFGGAWQARDPLRAGRVMRLALDPEDRPSGNLQAQAAINELQRLLDLEGGDWDGCAILARTHQYLWPIQALCELAGIDYFLAADKDGALPVTRQREFLQGIDCLGALNQSLTATDAWQQLAANVGEAWHDFFQEAFTQLQVELGDCQLSNSAVVAWLYDYAREMRQQTKSGLYLGTVHSAKGLEFRHVVLLDGGWDARSAGFNDERRLYYVGMTRAEQTLTLCEFSHTNPFSGCLSTEVTQQRFAGRYSPALEKRHMQLSLRDIDIGYAGRKPENDPIHQAIRNLESGATLSFEKQGEHYLLKDAQGREVGKTAKAYTLNLDIERCEVAGIVVRFYDDGEEQYRARQQSQRWEVVVPRLVGKTHQRPH